ncbi:acyl carrier protein [Streptomyces sp. NPDC046887]|uniref:acyl carrier protein n=1 Tax=Streptomyces sp. NPDC046887 TaxID=3155472 RepID=UPI003409D510
MDRQAILDELTAIVHDVLDLPVREVGENMSLVHDLELDSLRMVRLAVAAEDRFGITLSEEDTWELRTVADAVTFVQRALREENQGTAGADPAAAPISGPPHHGGRR